MADPSLAALQGQAYAKLFLQQQLFAAQHAKLFSHVASGNRSAIDEIIKRPDSSFGGQADEGENGKRKRKRHAPRDPDKPKRAKTGCKSA